MYKGESILCHRSAREACQIVLDEGQVEDIPERTDTETTNGPSNRDLR
jgi:hypothetical protein